jgi:uncharacterized protein YjbI with pentapeptide repeats
VRGPAPLDSNDPAHAEVARRIEAHRNGEWAGERFAATGLDLGGKLLDELYLHQAYLTGCSFDQASMRGADLSSANLGECSFSGAQLRDAVLAKAFAYSCDFREADLAESNLIKFSCTKCDFRQARLRAAQMLRFQGTSCDFRGADLRDVGFLDTSFGESLMAGANLAGASGTITGGDHAINVGTEGEARLLRGDELLDWFRAAGAVVEWFVPPRLLTPDPDGNQEAQESEQ